MIERLGFDNEDVYKRQVLGCVVFLCEKDHMAVGESEYKLAQTIAGFLGRHMET